MSDAGRLLNETVISLAEAAAIFPGRHGKRIHPATIFRWCVKGTLIPNGIRVKLEYFRAGSRMFTTREALVRYLEMLEPEEMKDEPDYRSPAERRRACRRAEEELRRRGC